MFCNYLHKMESFIDLITNETQYFRKQKAGSSDFLWCLKCLDNNQENTGKTTAFWNLWLWLVYYEITTSVSGIICYVIQMVQAVAVLHRLSGNSVF